MKHSLFKTIALLAVFFSATLLHAHDFEAVNEDGVTIYYNIISTTEKTCEVTFKGTSEYNEDFSGVVNIPETVAYSSTNFKVTSIGKAAFYGCSGLTSVNIPNSVTSIEWGAFQGCSGLTSVTIPNKLTSIGERSFRNCIGLTSVTIPNSVTHIGDYAFYGCSGLISMTIPNNVTSIRDYAFYGCSDLTSVTIPNSVTSIGNSTFSRCSGLTSVTIPNSVTDIGSNAFSYCSGLTSLNIPNSVTSIGSNAFCRCSGLTSVTISNSVRDIGKEVFRGCSGLTSVTIPNCVIGIGEEAFGNCSGLTSVTIPNSVISLGVHAFAGCSGLTSVTIPNSVTYIGSQAFSGCSAMTEVISNIETPFDINYDCFSGTTKANATLYVPKGMKEAYQAVTGWDFLNINDGLASYQLTLTGNEGGIISYNGENIENTTASFEIREGKSFTIKLEPYEKYQLMSLRMNGLDVMNYMDGDTFTADDIDSDVEIVATFDLIDPYIKITPTNKLQTFCSEDNLNFSEVSGLTAYIVVGYKPSAKELLLTPVIEVPAGTGVLLKGEVGKTYKVPTMVDSDYNYSNALVGVLEDEEVTTGFVFDETFKAVDGSAVVPANTAYLLIPAATEAGINELKGYLTDGPAVKGDLNGDGMADISDVVYLVNLILGQ